MRLDHGAPSSVWKKRCSLVAALRSSSCVSSVTCRSGSLPRACLPAFSIRKTAAASRLRHRGITSCSGSFLIFWLAHAFWYSLYSSPNVQGCRAALAAAVAKTDGGGTGADGGGLRHRPLHSRRVRCARCTADERDPRRSPRLAGANRFCKVRGDRPMIVKTFPVTRPFDVTRLGSQPKEVTFEPDEKERARLIETYDLLDLQDMRCVFRLRPWRKDGIAVDGHLRARATQPCVVTLAPVEQVIDETFSRRFDPRAAEEEETAEIEVEEWPAPNGSNSDSLRLVKPDNPSFCRNVSIRSRRPVRILCG